MVCTQYTVGSTAPPQPPPPPLVPTGVLSIIATKLSETATDETVQVTLTFDSGNDTSAPLPLKADGVTIQFLQRVTNGTASVLITVPKDGKAHQLCAV